MTLALAFAGLLLGGIVGSFLATLCLRWPEGRSVIVGRSRCDGCGSTLGGLALLPLIGVARRRASCCGGAIHPLHWQVEWAAALLGAAAMLIGGIEHGPLLALFAWLLLPLALLDARHFWLPDRLNLLLALVGLLLGGLLTGETAGARLVTGLVAAAGLALLGLAYRLLRGRQGLGGGDPKLLGALGLWLGPWLTLITLIGAALIGIAEALLARRGRTEAQPFGTLLAAAAWLTAAGSVASR